MSQPLYISHTWLKLSTHKGKENKRSTHTKSISFEAAPIHNNTLTQRTLSFRKQPLPITELVIQKPAEHKT